MADLRSQEPAKTLDEILSELAVRIERVKVLYEQYFMGIEKIPPETARKEVARAMLQLQQQQIRNTGLRFRFNTMLQKWNIYITYWNRTVREIEAGTYLPHIQKARRAAERVGKELPAEMKPRRGSSGELPAMPVAPPHVAPAKMPVSPAPSNAVSAATRPPSAPAPVPSTMPPASRPAPPPIPGASPAAAPPTSARPAPPPIPGAAAPRATPALASAAPPPRANIPGMSENDLRSLHQKYVAARATTGEAGQVSYQALVNSLARQVPKLLEQPGVKEVRFDVAVQQGKVVLKAYPKK